MGASLLCVVSSIVVAATMLVISAAPAAAATDPAQTLANSSLGALPDLVTNLGNTTYPSEFGGIQVTDGGTHLTIYLTQLDQVLEGAFSALPGAAGNISFAQAANPLSTLQSLVGQIAAAAPLLRDSGLDIVSVFPDVQDDGLVDIGVENLTAPQEATLQADFGANLISVHNLAPAQVPVATSSRTSDSNPWTGGDAVDASSGGYTYTCTTGPGVTIGGVNYTLTAAHCFDPGWTLRNQQGWNNFGSDTYMGVEDGDDTTNYGDDVGVTTINPSGYVWTGVSGSPVKKAVHSWGTNPDGDFVCNEGDASGEVCAQVINNGYGCIYIDGPPGYSARYACNMVWGWSSTDTIANQEGDSGGPVIRYDGSSLLETGVVSAGAYTTPCQYNTGSGSCYQGIYYTAMDEILSTEYPGSTIVHAG